MTTFRTSGEEVLLTRPWRVVRQEFQHDFDPSASIKHKYNTYTAAFYMLKDKSKLVSLADLDPGQGFAYEPEDASQDSDRRHLYLFLGHDRNGSASAFSFEGVTS